MKEGKDNANQDVDSLAFGQSYIVKDANTESDDSYHKGYNIDSIKIR